MQDTIKLLFSHCTKSVRPVMSTLGHGVISFHISMKLMCRLLYTVQDVVPACAVHLHQALRDITTARALDRKMSSVFVSQWQANLSRTVPQNARSIQYVSVNKERIYRLTPQNQEFTILLTVSYNTGCLDKFCRVEPKWTMQSLCLSLPSWVIHYWPLLYNTQRTKSHRLTCLITGRTSCLLGVLEGNSVGVGHLVWPKCLVEDFLFSFWGFVSCCVWRHIRVCACVARN